MKADDGIRTDDVRRAVEQVTSHPRREALGALALDVLSRQAEGRTLFAGKEHVEARAEAHGVSREDAAVDGMNLLAVFERGAESAAERALVAAFAIDALGRKLADADEGEREALAQRFVRHADWLEVSTPYVVYAFVDPLLEPEPARVLMDAMADAVLSDARAVAAPRHDARARSAARLSALAASRCDGSRDALGRVAREAEDLVVRALARELGGEPPSVPGSACLSGRYASVPRTAGRAVLRVVTGVAAVAWLGRLVGRLVGVRSDVEMELVPGGVVVRRQLALLGRTVRSREERFTLSALAGVAREVRYPMLHVLIGLVALAAGVLAGGLLAIDAVRTGETVLLLIAAGLVLLGGGLDLALDVLVPARKGKVVVDLSLMSGRVLRLDRVPVEDADRFLETLRRRSA